MIGRCFTDFSEVKVNILYTTVRPLFEYGNLCRIHVKKDRKGARKMIEIECREIYTAQFSYP